MTSAKKKMTMTEIKGYIGSVKSLFPNDAKVHVGFAEELVEMIEARDKEISELKESSKQGQRR